MRNTIKKTMLETGVRGCKPLRIKHVENTIILDVKFTEPYTQNEKYLIEDTLEYALSEHTDKKIVVREYFVIDTERVQVEKHFAQE